MLSQLHHFLELVGDYFGETSEVEILCLAWSRKLGGRCLAGLRMDGGGWVRPVGGGLSGALPEKTEAGVLDILRVSLGGACPRPHQPENWRLRRVWYNPWHRPCRRVGHLKPEELTARLETQACADTALLGSRSDRVSEDQLLEVPAQGSLALIEPENLRWLIKTGHTGERRVRAIFHWGGSVYNLAVTDPIWEQHLNGVAVGCHENMALCGGGQRVFLTISLSEPYKGDCYKLVAAVILL